MIIKLLYNSMSMTPPISGIGHYTTILSNNIVKHSAIEAVKYFDHWNILDQKPEFSSLTKEKSIIGLVRKIANSSFIAPLATSYLHYQLS
jgi:hypothetical protein